MRVNQVNEKLLEFGAELVVNPRPTKVCPCKYFIRIIAFDWVMESVGFKTLVDVVAWIDGTARSEITQECDRLVKLGYIKPNGYYLGQEVVVTDRKSVLCGQKAKIYRLHHKNICFDVHCVVSGTGVEIWSTTWVVPVKDENVLLIERDSSGWVSGFIFNGYPILRVNTLPGAIAQVAKKFGCTPIAMRNVGDSTYNPIPEGIAV